MSQGPGLFRQEALRHQYTSPEDLERPFRLIRIGSWLPLLALGLICAAGLVWAFVGRVPETVEGTGVLIFPGRVRVVEASTAGRVKDVLVTRDSQVREHDVIARLDMTELKGQLDLAVIRQRELGETDRAQTALEDRRTALEDGLRKVQEESLDGSIRELDDLLRDQEKRGTAAIADQRKALERSIDENKRLNAALLTKAESARRLAASRVVTGGDLLQAEAALTENNSQLATLEVRLTELRLRETETQQALVTQRLKLADLKVQRRQLDVKATQLQQETTLARATREFQLKEQNDRVKQFQTTLQEQGEIRSPYAGRVLEVAHLPGQPVAPGTALVTIDAEPSPGEAARPRAMENLAYFPIRTGKRIVKGMTVRVSPTSVQRERYGSILGTVERVSEYPVGSRTPAAAVGNPELAQALLSPGGVIEVAIKLETADTPTGFRWTSAGPPDPLSAGTTTRTYVTVEERRPITFLLPILRGWLDDESQKSEVRSQK